MGSRSRRFRLCVPPIIKYLGRFIFLEVEPHYGVLNVSAFFGWICQHLDLPHTFCPTPYTKVGLGLELDPIYFWPLAFRAGEEFYFRYQWKCLAALVILAILKANVHQAFLRVAEWKTYSYGNDKQITKHSGADLSMVSNELNSIKAAPCTSVCPSVQNLLFGFRCRSDASPKTPVSGSYSLA